MRLPALAFILLMSMASVAQSNPTTFINGAAGVQGGNFFANITSEDGNAVNQSSCSGSSGCFITFSFSQNELGILLPDFSSGSGVLTCDLGPAVVNPSGFCFTTGCQTVTYTASADNEDTCTDSNGQVWTVTTTQQRHWVQSGIHIVGPVWDGGTGTIVGGVVGKKHHKHSN